MATPAALKRLQREYVKILRDPPPYITAVPSPANILEWHFCVTGPDDSPYRDGYYHGKLLFPKDYPYKPPAILMITPTGRFKCNTRLCLSLSDFHPEDWNPNWGVASVLLGLVSFMLESTATTGSIDTSDQRKRYLAWMSAEFNVTNPKFRSMFPDLTEKMELDARDRREIGYPACDTVAQNVQCAAAINIPSGMPWMMSNILLVLVTIVLVIAALNVVTK